jgi:hypothetical protein
MPQLEDLRSQCFGKAGEKDPSSLRFAAQGHIPIRAGPTSALLAPHLMTKLDFQ